MKSHKIITAITLMAALTAMARLVIPFESWNQVEEQSPSIIVANCGERTRAPQGIITINSTKSDSAIQIIYVLKGTNSIGSARLLTDHSLQDGEKYLVFARCDGSIYHAYEEYRVIPLGSSFHTNLIAGKSLNEQLHILFKRRLDILNRQMKEDQAEKQRLEEAFQN